MFSRTIETLIGLSEPLRRIVSRAVLLGASETLAVVDGALHLGRWQRVFLVELDGPRCRTLAVVVMGLPR